MSGIELATAYISLAAETSKLVKDINAALDQAEADAKTSGRSMGQHMADSFGSVFTGDMRTQMGTAGRQSGAQFSDEFGNQVDGDTTAGRRLARRLEADASSAGTRAGRNFADGFEDQVAKTSTQVRSAGQQAGSDAGDGFNVGFISGVGKLAGKGGPIATAATAAVFALKQAGQLTWEGMQNEAIRDVAQARIGIDTNTMSSVIDGSRAAFTQNFGDSIESNIDTAVAAWQSGLLTIASTPVDVTQVVAQLSTVSQILGEDIPAVARSTSQLVKTGMAKDLTEAFDLLVAGQQDGLNVSGDWLDTISEYSTQFRKLGLTGTEALGLIRQALQGGARDTDVAADALKEFSIRVVDGSESTRTAFQDLGLDADEMAARFAAGGQQAHDAMDLVLDKIRAIADPVEQQRVGVMLLGTQWEDLGAAVSNMDLSKLSSGFDDVAGASQRAADTVSANSMNEWETAKRNILGKIDEIKSAMASWNLGIDIPKGINDLFRPTPQYPQGDPGVRAVPNTGPGTAVAPPSSLAGGNPLAALLPYDPRRGGWFGGGRATGGAISGPGGSRSDSIAAWLSNGEHVLTARDVTAMGGQGGVYAFRNALHRKDGGAIPTAHIDDDEYRRRKPRFGGGNTGEESKAPSLIPPEWPWDPGNPGVRRGGRYRPSGPDGDDGLFFPWWMPGGSGWEPNTPGKSHRRGVKGYADGGAIEGGAVSAIDYAWDASGQPYQYGSFDCSMYMSQIYSRMAGLPPGRYFNTESDFAALGFKRGFKPGALNIGIMNGGGGPNSHMAGTLPNGINVENANNGSMYGPGAKGAQDFANQWYFEAPTQAGDQTVHGASQGAAPGPGATAVSTADSVQATTPGEGYIPSGAGSTSVPGTSMLSGFLNLGSEAIGGVIDMAASAASMAASGAANAAAPGSGMAASAGIQMGAQAAKRGVSYGFQMLGILGDSLLEQAFPVGGPPRWVGYDYTQFVPHLNLGAAQQAGQQAIGSAVDPNTTQHGQAQGAPPGPPQPGTPPGPPGPTSTPTGQPPDPNNPFNIFGFDQGGWLEPGMVAINHTNRPEPVFTGAQWDQMGDVTPAGREATYNVYPNGDADIVRELRRKERLDSMQYGGRP